MSGDLRISGSAYMPKTAASLDTAAKAETEDRVPSLSPEEQNDTPTLLEQMQEARKKAEEMREKLKLPKNSRRYGDAPIEAYSRLARARNAAQVASAAGYARRQIFQLKAAIKSDPDNARQIQGAIKQLQKAVARAGKKRKDLDREALAEKRRKKLMEEAELRKARRLQRQLQSQRTSRMLRESGYIREAEIDHRLHAQQDATAAEMREQFNSLSNSIFSAQDAAITRYAAQAASLEAPPPEPVVTTQA